MYVMHRSDRGDGLILIYIDRYSGIYLEVGGFFGLFVFSFFSLFFLNPCLCTRIIFFLENLWCAVCVDICD